jgi:hypothetical protein
MVGGMTPFLSGSEAMHSYYAGDGSSSKFVGSSSEVKSYDYIMNRTGTDRGGMAGFNFDSLDANVNLGDLATVGYVDLYLYQFSAVGGGLVAGPAADYQGIVRLGADGSVDFNPVPIPGALVLFASGLIGLVGIRRRNA